jgi:hypothetical protein
VLATAAIIIRQANTPGKYVLVFGWRLRLMAEILESGILYFHLSQSADWESSITAIPADTKNAGRRGLARTHEAEARAKKKPEGSLGIIPANRERTI